MDEAADEMERLQNGAAESRETVTCPHVVGETTLHCSLTPFTLTDEEREAVREAVGAYNDKEPYEECVKIAATLRGLLERLGGER
jgi:hypothetical protein